MQMYVQKKKLPELFYLEPICMSCRTCVGWTPLANSDRGSCSKLAIVTPEGQCFKGLVTEAEHGCKHWDSRVATLN